VLTSALIFWLSFFFPTYGGWVTTGWYDYEGGYYTYDYSYPDASQQEIKRRSSLEQRAAIDAAFERLRLKATPELRKMRVAQDTICETNEVDCQGLAGIKMAELIAAVIDDRQTERELTNAESARLANYISGGSLFVAFIALAFSALTYFGTWNNKAVKR
jgi:hypothetical protein